MHATPLSGAVATVAIDLAKDVFELAFADTGGRIVERRRLTRNVFAHVFDNHPPWLQVNACSKPAASA